ncbi:unnamed protein product [Cercopithifilaria johnstoni]|uniref:Uncharacterized protein n=1 Tax=Cercopithifilaria johnstoni TaxID=2874296 RepID=A0A8J2Q7F8_9BILA|nr:unnamed protein product [Cercopithifilaria johnstoni]
MTITTAATYITFITDNNPQHNQHDIWKLTVASALTTHLKWKAAEKGAQQRQRPPSDRPIDRTADRLTDRPIDEQPTDRTADRLTD